MSRTSSPSKRDPNRPPTHPGRFLREVVLPDLDRSKTEVARLLGVSRPALYDVLNEQAAVSPAMALRLGRLFGNGPDLWLTMQVKYDLWRARQEIDLSEIPDLKAVG